MKLKSRTPDHSAAAAAALLAMLISVLLLAAPAAAAGPGPESVSLTLARPAEHTLEALFILTFNNLSAEPLSSVALPLPAGHTDVWFAVAPAPEAIRVAGDLMTDATPLAAGERRQYVYRAALPLPDEGARFSVTVPWEAADALLLLDGEALRALPGPELAAAGTMDIEGHALTAFAVEPLLAGDAIALAVSPGTVLSGGAPAERPTRWSRLQANLAGTPAQVLALTAAAALAVWATAGWRRQAAAPGARLQARRAALISQIASLDVASAAGTASPGHAAERERLFNELLGVAAQLGEQVP